MKDRPHRGSAERDAQGGSAGLGGAKTSYSGRRACVKNRDAKHGRSRMGARGGALRPA